MSLSKSNKLINLLNYRLRITLADQRILTGHMLAYDTHMNLVIAECEEFRKTKPKGSQEEIELKRTLGLVILRGEHIISISVDGPPPPSLESQKARMAQLAAGSGVGRPAGRGMPIAPPGNAPGAGLTGPARGLGAPAPVMMQPRGSAASAAPVPYARPMPGGAGMPARPGMPMPPPMGFRPGMPPPPGFRPGMPMPPGMRPPGGMPPPPFPPGHMGPPGGPMAPGMQRPNAPPPPGFRPPPGPGGPPPRG